MPFTTTTTGIRLFYNDWGTGRPIVLIHGWPLSGDMWADQAVLLAESGFRVIMYDRRGFGRSDQPWDGYDYDTFAADLAGVIDGLDLEAASLVGFSMGGGEVARYLARYGSDRIAQTVLVSADLPYMLKAPDNPDGIDRSVFDQMIDGLGKDRASYLAAFSRSYFGNTVLHGRVSDEAIATNVQTGMQASYRAMRECVRALSETDFRADMAAFDVPTLVVHGTADQICPIDLSARTTAKLIPDARLIEYEDEPHALYATAKERLGRDLIDFLSSWHGGEASSAERPPL